MKMFGKSLLMCTHVYFHEFLSKFIIEVLKISKLFKSEMYSAPKSVHEVK